MKFIANENLYDPIIFFLNSAGNDVLSVRHDGMSGISDDEVYQIACKEKRVIITMDKDFAKFFRFPPENCGGIILVKIYKRNVDDTLNIFKKHYNALNKDDISGNLTIITQEGVRIKRS